jgi:nitrogen regulatory protein PII-like uncharacterized protein
VVRERDSNALNLYKKLNKKNQMITQVVQFKNLEEQYKTLLKDEMDPERAIYIVKDNENNVKSITTSVVAAIQKTQSKNS